jgi:hypothetical protein
MSQNPSLLNRLLRQIRIQRGMVFGIIILSALFAFETFNYSTTEYALTDLLGSLRFAGIHWSTILSIAFCGIDFAGIARLFTPGQGSASSDPHETWYLFGAWFLAATMNAMLTWWGVSLAVIGHKTLGNAMIGETTLLKVVPIFVALMVWLIRILIIGTFSVAGDHLFSQGRPSSVPSNKAYRPAFQYKPMPLNSGQAAFNRNLVSSRGNPAPKPAAQSYAPGDEPSEPTYHPLSAMTGTLQKTPERRQTPPRTPRF